MIFNGWKPVTTNINHQPPTVAPRLNSFISSCANFASNSWGAMAAPEDPNVGNKNQHHWSRKVAGDEWSKKMCSQMRMFLTYIFWKKGWPCLHLLRHLTGQPRTLHWSQKMATGCTHSRAASESSHVEDFQLMSPAFLPCLLYIFRPWRSRLNLNPPNQTWRHASEVLFLVLHSLSYRLRQPGF